MGHKKVCLQCRKAFSIDIYKVGDIALTCPDCGGNGYLISHRFRPPAKDDLKKWQVVEILIKNGFPYDHVYEDVDERGHRNLVKYPETIQEAREFVVKYQRQARLK